MGDTTELVEVAFVGDEVQALVIQNLLEENGIPSIQQRVGVDAMFLAYGALSGGGSRQVLVHAHRAEEARVLLDQARAEDENIVPEPADAEYLAEAQGRRPRNYSLIGGYARIYLVSFGVMALALGVFLLTRAL